MSELAERLTAALADRYRIERELGTGGMATVYLAEDLKHQRQVAIKVLKPELAAVLGAERFVQEITTTAQLQHPHILPLFDSGTADGFLFYVMPYIEGETLRDKLDRETQLGVEEAVRITTEVADALDYAHRQGVIHRDIKPENILLHDGRPMVADFGIALAVSAAAGGRMTETGMSLGTPHYMSPEQATADKEVTGRSDIYSLASVLYEMLTGDPPHTGSSAQQIIVKIIADEARPVGEVRKSVPPNVAAALAKGLEKLPADRFESARAFAEALADPSFRLASAAALLGAAPSTSRRQVALTTGLAAAAVASLAVAGWALTRPVPPPPVIRYQLPVEGGGSLVDPVAASFAPVVSSDGSRIIYPGPGPARGDWQLWVKRRDQLTAEPLANTTRATAVAVSPDGRWVAVIQGGALKKLAIDGGPPLALAEGIPTAGSLGSLTWLDDGTLLYAGRIAGASAGEGSEFTIMQIPEDGGTATAVWSSDSLSAQNLTSLPGGRALFEACTAPCDAGTIHALDPARGVAPEIIPDAAVAHYAEGVLAFARRGGALLAVAFDLDALETRGEPVATSYTVEAPGGQPRLALSASGTLVVGFGRAPQFDRYQLVWTDRDGRETPVDSSWTFQVTQWAGDYGWALSPDDRRLAIGLYTSSGNHVWIKSLPRGPASLLTHGSGFQGRPRWTGDGRWVTFGTVNTLAMRRADDTGADSILFRGAVDEGLVSPDERWLLIRRGAVSAASGGRDIYVMELGVDSVPRPLLAEPYDEMAIALSPDGRQLAYQSNETGQLEVFVRPFPDVGKGKVQVSSAGGSGPLWSRDGTELFYLRGDNTMMAVPVSDDGALELGRTHELFRLSAGVSLLRSDYYTPWDVAKDGRFIMARVVNADPTRFEGLMVVENWLQEVKKMLHTDN